MPARRHHCCRRHVFALNPNGIEAKSHIRFRLGFPKGWRMRRFFVINVAESFRPMSYKSGDVRCFFLCHTKVFDRFDAFINSIVSTQIVRIDLLRADVV